MLMPKHLKSHFKYDRNCKLEILLGDILPHNMLWYNHFNN